MKHSEYIMALDADFIAQHFQPGISVMSEKKFLELAPPHLIIRRRAELEFNPHYRQLIPYTVIAKEVQGEALYFAYEHGKGVGEQRLAGNVSVGVGGHIDLKSISWDKQASTIHLQDTIYRSTIRELNEEIQSLQSAYMHKWEQAVLDCAHLFIVSNDDVGRVHFGIVMTTSMPERYEFRCREDERRTIGFKSAAELLADETHPLEPWSRLYLEYIVKHQTAKRVAEQV